jgi:hypothetical protein
MGFLTVNHNQAGNNNEKREFTPIAEGEYEAIISEAKIGKSSAGNDMITVTLTIRDDVNQQFAKRKIWDYLVYTEKAMFKFQQVAKALAIPEGTKIDTIHDFAKAIQFASVRISVKNREEEYNGEKKIRDFVATYKEPHAPARQATQADPFQTTAPSKTVSNDLPI